MCSSPSWTASGNPSRITQHSSHGRQSSPGRYSPQLSAHASPHQVSKYRHAPTVRPPPGFPA
eukprot:5224667-Heterocapsa_arctica.AAC.1